MITTAFLGLLYGEEKNLIKRFKEYFCIIMVFIFALIGSGRIHYITDFSRLIHQNSVMFYENVVIDFGIKEKFFGYTNLCASSLLPVAYEGTEINFYWTHLTDKINYFGLLIILICIYTCIKYRKEKKIYPFILWFIFSAVQFIIIGFGTGLEPLFSLCFSWAIISLFIIGVNNLLKNRKFETIIYVCLLVIMFYLNFIHFEELLNYLLIKAPL